MKLVKKIFNKLNGLYYPQEYLCLAKESFDQPLRAYLVDGRRIIRDITNEHLFIGYSPLIIALMPDFTAQQDVPGTINIAFTQSSRQPNEFLEKKDAIAFLLLNKIRKQKTGNFEIVYYEGKWGQHRFISSFHQSILNLDNRYFNKKPGNVFLHDNLYKQVQIAYSIPRTISLVTVNNDNLYNLFPTDLHGRLNDHYYVSSLRHGGKACQQVLESGRIVLSNIHCNAYKMAYSLGKNHMQEASARGLFPFGDAVSAQLGLPLPQAALNYVELERVESFDHGIHKLFLYRIVGQKILQNEPFTLAHIHNVYATWRHSKGLSGNYLLR